MPQILTSALFAGGLFAGVLACLRFGWRLGRRSLRENGENGQAGLGAVEGMIYGLVGLLIAFTFTGAANRFDGRRDLIGRQVNAIGTAWMRLDLLEDPARARFRELFRQYVDLILELSANAARPELANDAIARLSVLEGQIWSLAVTEAKSDRTRALNQSLLPSLNDMFDVLQSRLQAAQQHPPAAVFVMLGFLILVSGLMAGFGMAKSPQQSSLHVFGFAVIMSLSVYLILDIEYPRLGLVQIRRFDRALVVLRESMAEPGATPGLPR